MLEWCPFRCVAERRAYCPDFSSLRCADYTSLRLCTGVRGVRCELGHRSRPSRHHGKIDLSELCSCTHTREQTHTHTHTTPETRLREFVSRCGAPLPSVQGRAIDFVEECGWVWRLEVDMQAQTRTLLARNKPPARGRRPRSVVPVRQCSAGFPDMAALSQEEKTLALQCHHITSQSVSQSASQAGPWGHCEHAALCCTYFAGSRARKQVDSLP